MNLDQNWSPKAQVPTPMKESDDIVVEKGKSKRSLFPSVAEATTKMKEVKDKGKRQVQEETMTQLPIKDKGKCQV